MKAFVKYTLSTIVGIIITTIIVCIIGLVAIVGIIAADDNDTPELTDNNTVLVVKLSGILDEHVEEDTPFGALIGDNETQGADDIVAAIEKAATTPEIAGIYIEAGLLQADYSVLQEIRNALLHVKEKKKWVISFADTYTQNAYYVCSAADEIWLNPQGMVDIHGLAGQTTYLKDLLAKVGIKMKVIKVGTYKSATEMFTEDHMSDANREQTTRYIQGLWDIVANDIAKGKDVKIKSYRNDELENFRGATLTINIESEQAVSANAELVVEFEADDDDLIIKIIVPKKKK